jgi:hypothetical protein
VNVRVPIERKRALEALAKRFGTSVAAQFNIAVANYVEANSSILKSMSNSQKGNN